jgi:replication fork protection complex subunit Csm3/Swi3
MSLTDLFSADSPPPDSPPRRREALFLDAASTPSRTPLKRRYNDFDDEPLSPSLDMEDLDFHRETERRHDGEVHLPDPEVEGIAPRAIAELFDDPLAAQDPLALGGATEEEPKRRRVMAKVDAERLLAPKGLPALMAAARRFKAKGKGHEVGHTAG